MRFIATLLTASLLLSIIVRPLPAAAMSTAKEVAQGTDITKQIDQTSVVVTDPFLKDWVQGIGAKLSAYRARTDVNYQFTILDDNAINSFALPGGYVHAEMGLLNFVSSDDELASVMGHEMGHIERRHVVTLNQKGNILSVLIGVLSILSPIVWALGGYGGDLAFSKFSRQDELQADQYGLLLMTRAGYDPHSSVDLFSKLDKMASNGPAEDKAFASHPAPKDRVAHLLGYPELDRPTTDQIVTQAIHDEAEGRYSYARARLQLALKKSPNNQLARTHLASVELALREGSEPGALSQRSLAAAGQADVSMLSDVAMQIAKAQSIGRDDARQAKERARSANQEIESLFNVLQGQTHSVPNLGSPKKQGNNLSLAIDGLNKITRAINATLDLSSDAISQAPKLAVDNLDPLKDMAASISDGPPTLKTRALLPQYPRMISSLSTASEQFVTSIDDARAAISLGGDAVKTLSDYLAALNSLDTTKGDISDKDMPKVKAALETATAAWEAAAAMAYEASNTTYAAQTATLSTQISLLDLFSSKQRFDGYRHAVAYRFPGVALPDYQQAQASGLTAGDLGCTAWLSYETKASVNELIRVQRSSALSCTDLALQHKLLGESMEIAEGLLYEDYVDEPQAL